jgi:hypothetical protein
MAIHPVEIRGIHSLQSHERVISVTKPGLRLLTLLAAGLAHCACDGMRTPEDSPSSRASAPAHQPSARSQTTPNASAELVRRGEPIGAPTPSAAPPETTRLLTLATSAYHASLTVDDDAAFLLTSHAAYRLVPGRAPEAMEVELGFGATATRHALVFWSDGAVRETSKRGGKSRRLATLAARPQLFASSGDDIAWIERSKDKRFSLGSLAGKRASTAYASPGTIDAIAMLNDWIFFVERPPGSEWRIGAVRAKGGAPVFTSARRGRTPSMLAARHELYYYDGSKREVRRLSPDLRDEVTLVTDFICSPLAVAERVYCANVEGVFELVAEGRPRRLATLGEGRAVTDLAANAKHLFWVSDAGADKLSVHAIALSESP